MALESSSIVNFISRVKSDFARPNLFEVDLSFPTNAVSNAANGKLPDAIACTALATSIAVPTPGRNPAASLAIFLAFAIVHHIS